MLVQPYLMFGGRCQEARPGRNPSVILTCCGSWSGHSGYLLTSGLPVSTYWDVTGR